MRLAQLSPALRSPWIPAAVATLALFGCGGSDEGKSPETASTAKPDPAKPAKAAKPGAKAAGDAISAATKGVTTIEIKPGENSPLVAPLDGPVEYEEAAQKPLVATFPEAAAPAPKAPAIAGLPAEDAVLGQPLVIDGKVVPFDEVRRQCCLGRIGFAEIETAKLGVYIEEEIQRLLKTGKTREELTVGDAELDDLLNEIQDEIKVEYPEGGMTMEDVLSSLGTDAPKERLRINRLFQKLYLPDNPADYPPVTIDAILASEGGDSWLEQLKQSYAERQKAETPKGKRKTVEMRALDEAILQQVIDHLTQISRVETAPAPGVLYRINGVDITVPQIWERIKPLMTAMEVHAAKQWIVNSTLLKDALVAAGAWLSDEEADAAYHAHSDPFKDSIFSYERIALAVKQFPSVDRYKEYRRFYESYHRMKQADITPDALKKHAEFRTNKIVGQVSVDVDVILCSAFDIKGGRWKPNGWVDAENRMRDVLQLLVEEQQPWEVMVEKYSDFYQQPVPVSQRDAQTDERPVKGRFRNFQRNNLLGELGESEYGLFLNGSSITDFIFYEQEVGTLGQPMRGPLGWYLPRLLRRSKAPRKLTSDAQTMDALTLDDYLTWNLNLFVQDLIKKHQVFGLELPGTTPKEGAAPAPKEAAVTTPKDAPAPAPK